jgi:hypothetical protein
MKRMRSIVAVAALFSLGACYHAVIETGRPAGTEIISNPWANSFIYGLVPPQVVNVASQCPGGVSKVETQHSFLNGLVASITFGIYTPMQIDVTCAAGGRASIEKEAKTIRVGDGQTLEQVLDAAVRISNENNQPVYVVR